LQFWMEAQVSIWFEM